MTSFVPVIKKQKLYSWIPSLLFLLVEIIAIYLSDWTIDDTTPKILVYTIFISKIAFYLSMLPNFIRYNIYIVALFYIIISGIHIYMLYCFVRYINHEIGPQILFEIDKVAKVLNNFDMVFPFLEITYQMFRRRMFCFKWML